MRFKYLVSVLGLIAATVWLALITYPTGNLEVIACDVGQGDAILVIKGTKQILIDGGPGKAVMQCLGNHMPFWDRTLEMVILTNPDSDHFYGLINVVKDYDIDLFVANPIIKEGKEYKELVDTVVARNIPISNPIIGTRMKLEEITLDFISPTPSLLGEKFQDNSGKGVLGAYTTNRSVNELSLVFNLKYKDFDALFTGDIEPSVIDEILKTNTITDVDYLKVPHHGSKNGLNKELLEVAKPEIAVISVGKKNRYDHPSDEILEILSAQDIRVLRTDEVGDVTVQSNGKSWWIRN